MIRKMVPIHQPITFQSNIVEKNGFHSFVERMLGISDHIKLFNSSEQAMKESRTLIWALSSVARSESSKEMIGCQFSVKYQGSFEMISNSVFTDL